MDKVAQAGPVCKEKVFQTWSCSGLDSRSQSSQLSGQASSARGVSLSLDQISGPGSSGFNCQLEQVPEMSQISSASQPAPLLSAVRHPTSPARAGDASPFLRSSWAP